MITLYGLAIVHRHCDGSREGVDSTSLVAPVNRDV